MLNESSIYVVGIFIHLLDLKFVYFYSCYYWYLGGWYNRPRNKASHVSRYGKISRWVVAHLAVISMILSYVLAAVLWIVGWTVPLTKLEDASSVGPYHLLLLSNSFYAFAVLLTFFEASHLLQVDSTLGPLHLSLMMMTKDIVRFFALFALNFCAFAFAMRKLYSQYVQLTAAQVAKSRNATNTSHPFER